MHKEFRSLISLEEARSILFGHPLQTGTQAVLLQEVRGRILAEKIVSSLDVPGFSRASMDGYAVHSQDTLESREDRPVSLHLAGCVPMGVQPEISVSPGEAAEVSTGSMMPAGADSVVMIEYSQAEGEEVLVHRPIHIGENVQAAGSDISYGEAVLFPGTRLGVREIGVLAALGQQTVRVRSLKVGVASTGNELVPGGQTIGPGQIYDINSYTIASAVQDSGASAKLYGILSDSREEMAGMLQRMARECDMILVSGSTSAGAGDMIYQVLDEIGELIFHGVNLKPGKPTLFGLIEGKPCLGLPGYPTSALTVYAELAAPCIRRTLGYRALERTVPGKLAGPFRTEGRQQMLPVGISNGLVYPVDKGSGSITSLAAADGVIEIPAGQEYLERGEAVVVRLFAEANAPDLVVAGENASFLEKMAEDLPWHLKLLGTGSLRGRIYLEDGVADLAFVADASAACTGMVRVASYRRQIGFIFRDSRDVQDLEHKRLVGWHRDCSMKAAFEKALKGYGLSSAGYVRAVRTHSAVAAAIASGRADVGYGERAAAQEAGLGFLASSVEELQFLGRPEIRGHPFLRSFISALPRA
jgi:putative molybdopterin biosynthesis protein